MNLVKATLHDCLFAYNDISSTKEDVQDIEVSFKRLIVCFRHTFLHDTFKIHIEFCGYASKEDAETLANKLAKMSGVVDSPELVVNSYGIPERINAILSKATMYTIAKLLIFFTRFPILENHEENIL